MAYDNYALNYLSFQRQNLFLYQSNVLEQLRRTVYGTPEYLRLVEKHAAYQRQIDRIGDDIRLATGCVVLGA